LDLAREAAEPFAAGHRQVRVLQAYDDIVGAELTVGLVRWVVVLRPLPIDLEELVDKPASGKAIDVRVGLEHQAAVVAAHASKGESLFVWAGPLGTRVAWQQVQ